MATAAIPGQSYTLYMDFYDEESGVLTDPDTVELDITYGTSTDQGGQAIAGPFYYEGASAATSGQIYRIAQGHYGFQWPVPVGLAGGVYVANWPCGYQDATFLGEENFTVLGGAPLPVPAGDVGYWGGSLDYAAGGALIEFGAVDDNGIAWLWQKLDGWDGPDVQGGGVIPMSGDQGAWPAPQYFAARTMTLTVTASAPTQELRDLARQLLSSAVPVSDLAVLTVGEPVPKLARVRRSGKITETYPTLCDVTFAIGLVAPDPRKYGVTPLAATVNAYAGTKVGITIPTRVPFTLPSQAPAGSLAVSNAGNFETRPLITIVGPITSPALTNVTTGQTVSWNGTVVPAGSRFVVDFALRQASVDNSYRPADPFSSWWTLPPGTSTIQLSGQGDSGAQMTVGWSPAYI